VENRWLISTAEVPNFSQNMLGVILIFLLSGCIAPVPVKSVDDPWISGKIVSTGVPAAGIEVWLNHENQNACERPELKTLTDTHGHFEFAGKMRSWTWVGWANNHDISGCIISPDGPRLFELRSVNDPKLIEVSCDIAKTPREMCEYDCGIDAFDGRC
jgi:hypothetical protein